jgi:hypothetical protein
VPVLYAAALLAGTPDNEDDDQLRIPLVVANVSDLHRRRLWEAWDAGGRCGRWSALHRINAKIAAASKPEKVEPYARPRPMIQRNRVNVHGGYSTEYIDPEDHPTKDVVPDVERSA